MFVIEGADHLGKTTLAKQIVELAAKDGKYPIRYQHMSRQNSAFNYGSDYLDLISKYAVQDRFHLGALVYHDPIPLTPKNFRQVKLWLKDVASMTLVLHTSDEKWLEQQLVEHGKEEMFSVPKILEVNRKYRDLLYNGFHGTEVHNVAYDIGAGNYPPEKEYAWWLEMWYRRMELAHNTRRMYIPR